MTQNKLTASDVAPLILATAYKPDAIKALLRLIALIPAESFDKPEPEPEPEPETATSAPSAPSGAKDERIGHPVIVRSHKAGVYVGVLHGFIDNNPDCPILAPGSRQIHYWGRGGSVSSLATVGMVGDGHRLTPAVNQYAYFSLGAEVVQIVQIKDAATYQTFLQVPEWTGQ